MGIADITGIGAVADLANTVVNKIWPDKSEQERAEITAAVALVQGQLEINKAEAGSSSLFVAGWRPSIGWVCSAACAWNWIGLPVAKAGLLLAGLKLELSPADLSEMMPVMLGMLGLGAMRSFDKVKGVAR